MAAEPSKISTSDSEVELRNTLIQLLGLSGDVVESILRAAAASKRGFSDAALDLGIITQKHIQEAVEIVRAKRASRPFGPGSTTAVPLHPPATIAKDPEPRQLVRVAGKARPGVELASHLEEAGGRWEAIRSLRTELLLSSQRGQRNGMLAVLSAEGQDGRSVLAGELALSFAQLGRKTLLVDADLRNPSQNRLFNSVSEWGLAQAIAFGELPVPQEVEGFDDLALVVSGAVLPNPLEMFTSPNFQRLVSIWSSEYEFVIFDTPPLEKYSDALLIAKLAGRGLLVSRAAKTHYTAVKTALRRIEGTQAVMVGSVLNRF